jgi:L-alanine-DL-glutamate epimerase-like enolase superfamily enzyme
LKALGVEAIEQPVPAADDNALAALKDRPVPLVADESCHGLASLPHIIGKYDYINVKLDKTGGLTEALTLVEAARAAGLKIMVGCMLGSSLAMAPAMVAAVGAEIVDLDGPLLLAEDVTPPLRFTGSVMHAPEPGLWG